MNRNPSPERSDISQDKQTRLVDEIATLIKEHYAIERRAAAISEELKGSFYDGEFKNISNLKDFGKKVTDVLHTASSDLHFRVSPSEQPHRDLTQQGFIEHWFTASGRDLSSSQGFPKAEILEDNIGYIKTEGFFSPELSFPRIDAAMKLLGDTDTIIIDLRSNGGGKPKTVQYFCSYFFDEHILLNSLIWRKDKQVEEYWTLEQVNGKKLLDIDIYILTSSKTFSAGEEFAYNMQAHHNRCTLIGEQTGGGANPGDIFSIDNLLEVFIPTGQAFNPVTQTNWEGIGVQPDIETNAEQALIKAIELAKHSAKKSLEYKKKTFTKYCKKLMHDLEKSDKALSIGKTRDALIIANNAIEEAKISLNLKERDLRWLSNQYRERFNSPQLAELIEPK